MPADSMNNYLARRSLQGGWQLESVERGPFRGGIIIPALAESASIPLLLDALCADHSLPASGLAVLFVVNNREDASAAEKDDNQQTLALLRCRRSTLPFPLLLVDAASGDLALSARDGGVGTARKLGHDLLLPRLDFSSGEPLLISLDADTLVAPGYAGALVSHFAAAGCGGAVIPYIHRAGASDAENSAIERYELFLRCYVAGLAAAGSPYAFHTVGSAMACTVSAYLRCGGMNKRRAGEDFYFLQALAKTSGVAAVNGTMVFPSPRRSTRVPFGTGRAVGALLAGDAAAVLFHRPESFRILQEWLELARQGGRDGSGDLLHRAAAVSPVLQRYLVDQGFPLAWERLLQQHRSPERLCKGFDDWFDAFRTMKLLHLLAAELYPRDEPAELLHLYPQAWGPAELSCGQRLELLRQRQNGVAAASLLAVTAAAGSR